MRQMYLHRWAKTYCFQFGVNSLVVYLLYYNNMLVLTHLLVKIIENPDNNVRQLHITKNHHFDCKFLGVVELMFYANTTYSFTQ